MNTSKTNRRSFRLAIAAVLALALVASLAIVIAVANTTPTVAANVTISLDGKVNLIFRFAEDNLLDGTTKFEAKIGDGEATEVKHTVEEGVYTVSVPLMPYEMTETVVINHLDANDTPIGTSDCSVVEYANAVLTSDAHSDYHSAVKALLNYGAMTQIDADKNTDNLANEGLYSWGNPVEAAMKPITVSGTESANLAESTVFDKDGCSVFLSFSEGDIALKYNITLKEGVSADDLMATIDGVGDVKPVAKGTAYEFEIRNLSVDTFSKIWTVKVTCGEEEFTTKHSVLEYLMWNIGTEDQTVTATQKDVCAALYQLYKHTAAKDSLTDCKHNNTGYGVATATDGVSDILCGMCNTVLAEDISDAITYIPEKAIAGANTWEPVKAPATYVEEEDVNYVHYAQNADTQYGVDYVLLREKYALKAGGMGGDDGKLANKTINIGEAKYFVIRFRKTSDTNISIDLGSTAWTHENVTTAADQGAILTSVSLETTNSTGWVTYVVDLGAFDQTKFGAVDGKRVVDTLKIAGFGNAVGNTGDIDFVAFVNKWAEVDTLTPDATVQYVTTSGNATEVQSDGTCNHINNNKDDKCDACGAAVQDPGAYVLTGPMLTGMKNGGNINHAAVNGNSFSSERENVVFRASASDNQTAKGTPFNVGDAQYIVIKYLLIEEADSYSEGGDDYRLLISTTGKSDGDTCSYTSLNLGVPYPVYSGLSGTDKTDALSEYLSSSTEEKWMYLVVDAASAFKNRAADSNTAYENVYLRDTDEKDYIIDTMLLQTRGGGTDDATLKIAYIAFADDSAEINSLFENDEDAKKIFSVEETFPAHTTVVKPSNPKTTYNNFELIVNGKIQHAAPDCVGDCETCGVYIGDASSTHMKVTTEVVGNEYTTTCSVCGKTVATKDFSVQGVTINALLVPDNWLATQKGVNNTSTATQLAENGTWMARITGSEYIWMREIYSKDGTGSDGNVSSGTAKNLNVGQSKYMVVRVKAATASDVKFRISTQGFNCENFKQDKATWNNQESIAPKTTIGTLTAANTWQTIIFDLTTIEAADESCVWAKDDGASDYVIDTLSLVDGSVTDIAYIAFVTDEDDAQALAAADDPVAE